ncbi:tectonic-1 [Cimex lectularius]|uniref:Tectonic n=1 Tax=Cimex lectularius TaxID=79782 RepID=A0A8I6RWV2_CIMLE|nr:tectonic-1 [Cimex lectularius]
MVMLQSTTDTPKTTEIPKKEKEMHKMSSDCLCDLTSEKCDINCCCDVDCSESDHTTFAFCSPDSTYPVQHSGLCFSHQYIYKNNTRYKIKKNDNGIFCISKDNFPDRLHFVNQKIISSNERFSKVWGRAKHFTWARSNEEPDFKFDNTTNYKYGSLLWKLDNLTNELSVLKVPIQVTSNFCSGTRTVGYLENFNVNCLQKPPKDKTSCENLFNFNAQFFCNNLKLVGNPTSFNNRSIDEDIVEALVQVKPFICTKFGNCLEVPSLEAPFYNESSQTCINTLKSVTLLLYHNGSGGLQEGECFVSLHDVNILSEPFQQYFQVQYKWVKDESNVFHRSGTPGYIVGKPLISGRKAIKSNKEVTIFSKDQKDWISLAKSDSRGGCLEKTNILFGENLQTKCYFYFNENRLNKIRNCSILHSEIWTILMGDVKVNVSDTQILDTLIASFGDPLPDYQENWVPVHIKNSNSDFNSIFAPCRSLLSGVKYQFIYSYFGPFSNPQAKIIGATVEFLMDKASCSSQNCQLKLTSAVNYIDVSRNAVNKFAKAPVVKIKLPQDFFYPFSSKCIKSTFSPFLIITIVLRFLF